MRCILEGIQHLQEPWLWASAVQAACLDMSKLLQEMDSTPAWGYTELLLQDTPNILGNLELHTFVQRQSGHTSANISFNSYKNIMFNATMNITIKCAVIWFWLDIPVSKLSPETCYPDMLWEFPLSNKANAQTADQISSWLFPSTSSDSFLTNHQSWNIPENNKINACMVKTT